MPVGAPKPGVEYTPTPTLVGPVVTPTPLTHCTGPGIEPLPLQQPEPLQSDS